jgi:hypothetical protein
LNSSGRRRPQGQKFAAGENSPGFDPGKVLVAGEVPGLRANRSSWVPSPAKYALEWAFARAETCDGEARR